MPSRQVASTAHGWRQVHHEPTNPLLTPGPNEDINTSTRISSSTEARRTCTTASATSEPGQAEARGLPGRDARVPGRTVETLRSMQ